MKKYDVVFLSPHFDDAILSCGGLINKLVLKNKKVLVVTVFSEVSKKILNKDVARYVNLCGFDNSVDLNRMRKKEDEAVLNSLGVDHCWLGIVEADYRTKKSVPVYKNHKQIRNKINDTDDFLKKTSLGIEEVTDKHLKNGKGVIYCPLGLGGHADHRIINQIGDDLSKKWDLMYWEDYPYVQYMGGQVDLRRARDKYVLSDMIDIRDLVDKKKKLILGYNSQIDQLFAYKDMYLSGWEKYYKRILSKKNKKNLLHFVSDELNGGAKIANDYMENEFFGLSGGRLMVYEQVPVKIIGFGRRTRNFVWSIANFYRYLRLCVWKNDIVICTSPAFVIATFLIHMIGQKKVKVWFYCHADRSRPVPKNVKSLIYWWICKYLELLSMVVVAGVIVPSEDSKNIAKVKYGNRVKRIMVVKNGIDTDLFTSGNLKLTRKSIMYCGRIDPNKGLDKLIKAWQLLSLKGGLELVLVCQSVEADNFEYFEELKRIIGADKKIRFVFDSPRSGLVDLYRQSLCVVLPSGVESFSLVLLETFACGSLFTGQDVGEIGTFLSKIDSELILRSCDPKDIADKISYVLDMEKNKRNNILSKSKRMLVRYDWHKAGKKVFGLFDSSL